MTTVVTTTTTSTSHSRKRKTATPTPQPAPMPAPEPPAFSFTISQDALKRALRAVEPAVATSSALPVLSTVLLATDQEQGKLKLAATNLTIGITTWLPATIADDGAISVPHKLLADVVSALEGQVALKSEPRTASLDLAAGRFTATIKGIEAEEFPTIPTISSSPAATIAVADLRTVIAQVVGAAATSEARPVLTGVLIQLKDTSATFVAADGFRLAFGKATLAEPVVEATSVIVPAAALTLMVKAMKDESGDAAIMITEQGGQILFRTANLEVVMRLIEGTYPDVARIIPQRYATRAVLETQALAKAVKLASYFGKDSTLTLAPAAEEAPGRLTLTSVGGEIGENQTVLEVQADGAGGAIRLNLTYLAEAIAAVDAAQIAIEITSPRSPVVIRPSGSDAYLHIIMPMT